MAKFSQRAAQNRYKKVMLLVEQLVAVSEEVGNWPTKLSEFETHQNTEQFNKEFAAAKLKQLEVKAELLSALHHNFVIGGL